VSKKALREEIARLSAEGEREAQVVRALAKTMGDEGYCNYDACAQYLRSAYQAGHAAGRASLLELMPEAIGNTEGNMRRMKRELSNAHGVLATSALSDAIAKCEAWLERARKEGL
jgi:hypothetical protein